jgi:uncharacterized protein YecE (DUF72 family)
VAVGEERIHVGCSGWSYADWRGRLYPPDVSPSRWLELYARAFDTVEVNATFYRLPTRSTVARWAASTPPGFTFAVKASRYLTHVRRLRDLAPGVALLSERIAPLAESGKLGPLLWQLPPRFPRDVDRLAAALAELGPGRHAFEFRHESWFVPEVRELLGEHGVALVAADSARRPLPLPEPTASWWYVRLHDGRRRSGGFTPGQLRAWADRLREWGGEGYVFFNDDWQGLAVEEARRLRVLLGGAVGSPPTVARA